MIGDAIEYPFEGDDAVRTLAIGGGLYLASGAIGFFAGVLSLIPLVGWVLAPLLGLLALAPLVVLSGYGVAVSRSLMADEAEPPAFDDWGRYARDGLWVLGIALVYAIPAVLLAVAGAVVFGVASLLPEQVAAVLVVLASLVGVVVVGVYGLAVLYVFPAAFVSYARTGEVGVGWDVAALRPVLTDGDYAVAWAVGAIVLFAANSVGSSLTWILVGFAVFFYGQLVAIHLFTRGVADAMGGDLQPAAPVEDAGTDEEPPSAVGAPKGDEPDEGEPGAEDDTGAEEEPGAEDDTGAEEGAGAEDDTSDEEEPGDDAGDSGGEAAAGDRDGVDAERALEDVTGVGPTTAESLRAAGFEAVADLRAATADDLTAVEGIGPARADRIKDDLGDA